MTADALAGKVAVVPLGAGAGGAGATTTAEAVARRLAAEGASVVLVAGGDDPAAGRLAAELQAIPGARAAVFTLTGEEPGDLDALVELLAELFR
ncbi:MAG: hypothetical protein ABR540_08950 [Acidimicrobiales bacterium]